MDATQSEFFLKTALTPIVKDTDRETLQMSITIENFEIKGDLGEGIKLGKI